MCIIHFVRHGEVHNPDKVLYARLPRFRLSERGQQQATAAGRYLKDRPLATIISSPRLRARQTAAAIAAHHPALKVQRSLLLDEVLTPYQGQLISEMEAMGWRMYEDLPPGYEYPADLTARAQRLVARLCRQYAGQEVAVVSHGDVVLSMQFWARNIAFTQEAKNTIDVYPATASISTLTFANGAARPTLTYHQPY